jgi:hypothetical protein
MAANARNDSVELIGIWVTDRERKGLGSNLDIDIQLIGYLLDVRLKLPIKLQALLESRSPR